VRWWLGHEYGKSRLEAHVKPGPCERAYLVNAGILKDWTKLDEPVTVNMNHPLLKTHYKCKAAPELILPSRIMAEPKLFTSPAVRNLKKSVVTAFPDTRKEKVRDGEGSSWYSGDGRLRDNCQAGAENEDSLFIPEFPGRRSGADNPFLGFIASPEPDNTTSPEHAAQAHNTADQSGNAATIEKNQITVRTRAQGKMPTARMFGKGTLKSMELAFARAV
jgi:hypothetical protein